MTRFPIVVKKEGCAVSNLSWCELIGKMSLSFLFLLGLEFLEPQRFIIRSPYLVWVVHLWTHAKSACQGGFKHGSSTAEDAQL